jgi:hypothetical protein
VLLIQTSQVHDSHSRRGPAGRWRERQRGSTAAGDHWGLIQCVGLAEGQASHPEALQPPAQVTSL